MIVSLKYGNDVEMSIEQYLSSSESELAYLTAYGQGCGISDPFFDSILVDGEIKTISYIEEITIEEVFLEELLCASPNERIEETDFFNMDEF
jgi:hypothetical protein